MAATAPQAEGCGHVSPRDRLPGPAAAQPKGPGARCERAMGQDRSGGAEGEGSSHISAQLVDLAGAQQRMEAALGEIHWAVQDIAEQMRHQQSVQTASKRPSCHATRRSTHFSEPSTPSCFSAADCGGSARCKEAMKERRADSINSVAWPQSVAIRYDEPGGVLDNRGRTGLFTPTSKSSFASEPSMQSILTESPSVSRYMVNPNSFFHAAYNQLLLIVLCHDLTAIPVIAAWDLEPEGWLLWTAWSACLVWTLDLVLNFFTGVYFKGQLVMDNVLVAKHYLRRWFIPDLVMILCEWLSLLLFRSATGPPSRDAAPRLAEHARLLGLAGLLRLLKFPMILSHIVDKSLSEWVCWSLRCGGCLAGVLFLNHLIACAWFALGRLAHTDTGMRWVDHSRVMGGVSLEFLSSGRIYQWVTAMHWSFSTLTLGSTTDVSCYNSAERLFTIACMAIGLVFGSTVVSLFSASMIEHQMRVKGEKDKIRILRRFLRGSGITQKTSCLVMQQASERLAAQEKLREEDVQALPILSTSLQAQIRFELFQGHIRSLPLFNLWACMDLRATKRICMEALKVIYLRQQDDLFTEGTATDRAYYLSSGRMVYSQRPQFGREPETGNKVVEAARWMSEASLWTHWAHVGTARAATTCEVSSVSAEDLRYALRHPCKFSEMAVMYCQAYHRCIINAKFHAHMQPNDLEVPGTNFADLIAEMGSETRLEISLAVIDHLHLTQWAPPSLSAASGSRLHNEISKGQCCIILNSNHAERLVHLVQAHLVDQQGRLFVEFRWGRQDDPTLTFRLPSLTPVPGELPECSAGRLLEHVFIRESEVEYIKFERQEELDHSPSSQVPTRFVKHIHHMNLKEGPTLQVPICALPVRCEVPRPTGRSTLSSLSARRRTQLSHYSSERSDASDHGTQPHHAHLGRDIYMGREEDCFFAWLPPSQFALLCSPAGRRERVNWAKQLRRLNMSDSPPHFESV